MVRSLSARDTGRYAGLERDGVYRPLGTTDRYLVAYRDAGRGLLVQPDAQLALIQDEMEKKKTQPFWTITQIDIAKAVSFPHRDGLPAPDTLGAILKEPPLGRIATWGDKRNIEIQNGTLE